MNQKTESKRAQITKAGSAVFVAVAVAAVVIAVSAVSIKFLWERKVYNDRVIEAKTQARNELQSNATNIDKLLEQFPTLENSPTTNSRTILHALPPVYDYPALVTSLDYLAQISGVTMTGGAGADLSATAIKQSDVSVPQEIPLSFEVQGTYQSVSQFIENLERSIRPILVTSVQYSGTNADLKANIQAKTYYQPVRSLEVIRSPL